MVEFVDFISYMYQCTLFGEKKLLQTLKKVWSSCKPVPDFFVVFIQHVSFYSHYF